MNDTFAAATTDTVAPTAIEPNRVMILNQDEQLAIAALLEALGDIGESVSERSAPIEKHVLKRLKHGDEYDNPVDELTRITLRKRRLEAEVQRCNRRIADVEQLVVDDLTQRGETGVKHAATGATLSLARKVWIKVRRAGDKATPEEKAAAAAALIDAGLGDFVKPDFNSNTVSAYFREQVKAWDDEQRALPEHQRTPRTLESFLPDELHGYIELTDQPTISVRAPRT